MLRAQLKCLFYKREFVVTFLVMTVLSLFQFVQNCALQFGADQSFYLSADKLFIGYAFNNDFAIFLPYLLPILIIIPFSDSYLLDHKQYVLPSLLSRTTAKAYYWCKLAIVFFSVFCIIFIPFLMNFLLGLVAFPLESSNYSFEALSANQSPYYSYYINLILFPKFYLRHPYLYELTFLLALTFFCALCAVLMYQLSYFFTKNKILFLCFPFICNNFLILFSMILSVNISPFDYFFSFNINENKQPFLFWVYLLVPLVLILPLSRLNMKKLRFIN